MSRTGLWHRSKSYSLGFLLLLQGVVIFAQPNLSFRNLDRSDGLSQNTVFAIAQDRDGFIWFGTRDGLNRYDGYHFKAYRPESERSVNQIIDSDIRSLTYDGEINALWIGTTRGVSKYLIEHDSFINYRTTFLHCFEETRFCKKDDLGNLYFGTTHCLWRYIDDQDTFEQVKLVGPDLSSPELFDLAQANDGKYFVATNQGLFLADLQDQTLICQRASFSDLQKNLLPRGAILTLRKDRLGSLWIGTASEGLYIWHLEKDYIDHFQVGERGLNSNRIRAIAFGQNSEAWIGTQDGLNLLVPGDHNFQKGLYNHESETRISVQSLLVDQKGSLWVGTYFDGIKYRDADWGLFTHYRPSNIAGSINHKVVGAMVEDSDHHIWLATEGGGLNYFDPERGVTKIVKNELSGSNIKSLLMDQSFLWAGTYQKGLNRLNLVTGLNVTYRHEFKNPQSLPNDNVYGLAIYQNDLWIATYGGGLARMKQGSQNFDRFQHDAKDSTSLSHDLVRALYPDNQDNLWVGTDQGLDKLIIQGDGSITFEHVMPDINVLCVMQDSRSDLWIGTRAQGIFKIDYKGISKTYEREGTFEGASVFGILEDDKKQLWFSTGQGIFRLDPDQESFVGFSDSEGIEDLEFNFNAFLKTSNSEMYFGSTNGLVRFDPGSQIASTFIPPLVFTDLSTRYDDLGKKQKTLNYQDHLTLSYHQASFSIGFSALDFSDPSENSYKYFLEGLDQEWHFTKGRPLSTYTIQKEGDYLLKVKGSNNHGVWNPEERVLAITVLPPFYRSTLARLGYGLLAACIIYLIYLFIQLKKRVYLEKMGKRQQEKLLEERLNLYTDIAHEFRNPLTLILSPIDQLINSHRGFKSTSRQLQSIKSNALKMLDLVDQLISFRKAEMNYLSMQVQQTDIAELAKSIFDDFILKAEIQNIDFNFATSEGTFKAWVDRDKIGKVITNLLSNAFKFSPPGGEIWVRITRESTHIHLQVADSGPGIPPENRRKVFDLFYHSSMTTDYTINSGVGLALAKKMVGLHHGVISITENQPAGSIFSVTLPLGIDHFPKEAIYADNASVGRPFTNDLSMSQTLNEMLVEEVHSVHHSTVKLLIIEDNWDLLQYLKEIFGVHYRLLLSQSSRRGLELARTESPDLIISDVMMADLDGVQFCVELKKHQETSHIPIVLLTALSAKDALLRGLNAGADDYLVKPFDPDELLLRVKNILDRRTRLRARFTRAVNIEPESVQYSSMDESFLEKALLVIEKNMSNVNFTTNDFAKALMVSRPLLFSKIKKLTSMTPNNLIKTVRLKRAYQILEQKSHSVTEVCKMVGFKDTRYFSRCFEKQYSINPSQVSRASI